MRKAFIFLIIAVLALPLLVQWIPDPLSYERIETAYRAAGYLLENPRDEPDLGRGQAEGWSFFIDGYRIEVLRYTDRGKIALQLEYLKPDPGTVMVESMNMAQSLGARQPAEKYHAQRRGMFLVYVRGPDRSKCQALARVIDEA